MARIESGKPPEQEPSTRASRWRSSRALRFGAVPIALLVAGGAGATIDHFAFAQNQPAELERVIDGEATCSGEPVVGVWVDVANGSSGFARHHALNDSRSVASFAFRTTLLPGGETPTFAVDVGCGGTSKDWEDVDSSTYVEGTTQDFACDGATNPGTGFCNPTQLPRPAASPTP